MAKPSHVEAFDYISEGTHNEIRDYIAFGIFMQSEKNWVAKQRTPDDPDDAAYRLYHHTLLNPYERERYRDAADKVLRDFATRAISAEHDELLKHHRRFRGLGILEAVFGALAWTAVLIAATIAARRVGIDLLEVYKHAAGRG
jgi:hypothetical protein